MDTSFERGKDSTVEWYTPQWIVDALGRFDLDPCAPANDFRTAERCYTKADNGLLQPWQGRVWLNPPYTHPAIDGFVRRLIQHGNGIAFLFNCMDSALWQDHILPTADAMLIMRGRVKFCDINDRPAKMSSGCGSILLAWGEENCASLKTSGIQGKYIELNRCKSK